MSESERRDAIVLAVMAISVALVGATLGRSVQAVGLNLNDVAFIWYVRFRLIDITTEVVALGALAYVVPRTRVSLMASRLAGVLGVLGVAAEIGEWSFEHGNRFLASEGGAVSTGIDHVTQLFACGAVVVLWYLVEHRGASREIDAPDLS